MQYYDSNTVMVSGRLAHQSTPALSCFRMTLAGTFPGAETNKVSVGLVEGVQADDGNAARAFPAAAPVNRRSPQRRFPCLPSLLRGQLG